MFCFTCGEKKKKKKNFIRCQKLPKYYDHDSGTILFSVNITGSYYIKCNKKLLF